jgi:quinol monooxygenase YgiN
MIDSLRIYQLKPAYVAEFVAAFRPGGMWYESARRLPGFVATDLLESRDRPQLYLSIDFWVSASACLQAQSSPEFLAFVRLLSTMTVSTICLGAFAFPHEAEVDEGLEEDFVTSVIRRVDRWVRPLRSGHMNPHS